MFNHIVERKNKLQNDGYIAITSVLIISAVVVAIGITVSLLSIGEGQSALSLTDGEETLQFVEGCMEDALNKSRNNSTYTGGNITRPEGTCTVSVAKAGNIWTITTSTLDTKYLRVVQAIITRLGTGVTLTSWREI